MQKISFFSLPLAISISYTRITVPENVNSKLIGNKFAIF